VRNAAILLVLLWLAPCFSHGAVHAAEGFDHPMATSVFSTALAFIDPRTLEPEGSPQLTVWGLRGLTALDPALVPELREKEMRLLKGGKPVFSAPLPADASPAGWGELAASMAEAAYGASDPVRQAGMRGIIRSFFDEMFNHLDPYSRYVPPGAADTERERRSGQVGLGMTLVRARGVILVADVLPGSPADDAGLRPGDRIISVDGHAVRAEPASVVDGWIAGQDGTVVEVVWRGRTGPIHRAQIERALVAPQTVTAERLGDVVLIHISGFSSDTDDQFASALAAGFAGHKVRGIVVDLRGNRGGLLRQAVSVVDQVMTAGLVTTTAGRNPQASRVWPAGTGDDSARGLPMVVLVDGRTASAAEIMAAALADNGRAVVVGSSTLGKGLVQTIAPLPDGGELFVTWSRVLAPGGWPLQALGVMPQICTSLGEDSLKVQLDDLLQGKLDMGAALGRHNAARAPLPAAQVVELRNACPAAEGRDADLDVAGFLLGHPDAYQTALTKPPAAP
jgi:carboxyl-terminal processing protease